MLYKRIFKLKEDTQSITDLKAAHRYLRSLEGTPTLHAQVLQWVFAEFGDSLSQPHFGAKCENAIHIPKSGKIVVLRDFQKLKRRFEGSNLLALARFLYQ
jgi:hypothetical protein